jgi:sugar phosphate isomerase/epimerase
MVKNMNQDFGVSRRQFIQGSLLLGVLHANRSLFAASPKHGWQIGCFTRPWAEFEYQAAFDSIAKCGFRYLGLMTTAPNSRLVISVATKEEEAVKIGKEARDRKLAVLSVYGGDFGAEQSLESGVEGLRRLIDLCVACGSTSLMVGGTDKAELANVYYEVVRRCCDEAQKKKVLLTVKPHGGLNSTGPQCRKIIEKVGHPNFKLWYDPGNIFYYSDGNLDPVTDAATVDGLVCGMSVKDYLHPKNVEVTPGTGQVKFAAVLTRLKKGGFRSGPLLIECLKHGDLAVLEAEAQRARHLLESIL